MKTLLCLGFALGLIAVASALTCKSCGFRALSLCFTSSSPEDCSAGNCSTTKASIGGVSLFSKTGCTLNCNATSSKDNIFNFDYAITCCNTDQCNSGNSIKISFSLGLGMALLWLLNAV